MSHDEMVTTALLAILSTVSVLAAVQLSTEPMLNRGLRAKLQECIDATKEFYACLNADLKAAGDVEASS